MSKHFSASEKLLLIDRYRNSNEKLSVFCAVNRLSETTFKRWLKRYEELGFCGLERAGFDTKKK